MIQVLKYPAPLLFSSSLCFTPVSSAKVLFFTQMLPGSRLWLLDCVSRDWNGCSASRTCDTYDTSNLYMRTWMDLALWCSISVEAEVLSLLLVCLPVFNAVEIYFGGSFVNLKRGSADIPTEEENEDKARETTQVLTRVPVLAHMPPSDKRASIAPSRVFLYGRSCNCAQHCPRFREQKLSDNGAQIVIPVLLDMGKAGISLAAANAAAVYENGNHEVSISYVEDVAKHHRKPVYLLRAVPLPFCPWCWHQPRRQVLSAWESEPRNNTYCLDRTTGRYCSSTSMTAVGGFTLVPLLVVPGPTATVGFPAPITCWAGVCPLFSSSRAIQRAR